MHKGCKRKIIQKHAYLILSRDNDTVQRADGNVYNAHSSKRFYQCRSSDVRVATVTQPEVIPFAPCPYLRTSCYLLVIAHNGAVREGGCHVT